MKRLAVAAVLTTLAASPITTPALAEPGGCLKYGAAGALAGRMIGEGNTIKGALAGCAAGWWRRRSHRNSEAAAVAERERFNRQRAAEAEAYGRHRQQYPDLHPPPNRAPQYGGYQGGGQGGGQPSPWTNPGAYTR